MTQIMVTIIPKQRKRLELIQTLDMLLGSLEKMSPKLSFSDTPRHISLQLQFDDKGQLDSFFESNEFAILKGAAKALATHTEMSVNGAEIKNILNK